MPNMLHCVRCDKQLSPVTDDDECYQPYNGIVCTSSGNYGSCVFDPMVDDKQLLFFLCDSCIEARVERLSICNSRGDVIPAEGNL